ncbi:MAG: Uma2 family endonuclease [Betaproteobacteria bacterium]|nr:Uma2 family endonuclease [Betaproteobacteria bacterium]
MHPAQRPVFTEADYLALEEKGEVRHEFVAGEVYAMAGGSQRHNRITLNAASLLLSRLKGRPCQVFMSDVQLHVARDQAYYYPDVMVTCSQERQAANEATVVDDPVLVMEVLSPSTENIDRREKLAAYRRLPSVQEYVLVSQDRHFVEIYRRQGEIGWVYLAHEPGDTVAFTSLGIELPIAELYAGTDVAAV